MSTATLQESDLIFSNASSELKIALGELKKHNLKISNRLNSIKRDSEFVTKVASSYGLPLVANERCGSWYIPPELKIGSAYFKSTDGHFGQWSFSLRRLNLQVLDVLEKYGGCVIIDSTRRGKSMPDALSKTVPIWCCVLNRLLFGSGDLSTPMDVVGESEHAQIDARLDDLLEGVNNLRLDLKKLRQKLDCKPIQVSWQRPGDELAEAWSIDGRRNLIVLCTASNQTSNETSATSEYVQGAADDPESWSLGLDASLFWKHQEELLSAGEDELSRLIGQIVELAQNQGPHRQPVQVKPTSNFFIGTNAAANQLHHGYDIVISCTMDPDLDIKTAKKSGYIALATPTGKNGSRVLRNQLPNLSALEPHLKPDVKVLITCETGKDLAVGVALALLCQHCDQEGRLRLDDPKRVDGINKTLIKHRLSWIMVSIPDVSPSRATLQSVNAYLMG
ncbi:tRNA A64-2'-O-ribosylphosphate transferase [Pseudocercospora fuligena]|uniref:tRNA A64-2'-O-ribosylphosphate transferase n=1 Tax=Pseudocercospora fuligena TaxID=685502 RepID=A0A8H6VDX9_9PEZI|nr:tRNA A64-2'-O-ribosylphosphate transferase [Pseudocercospora fuligena]